MGQRWNRCPRDWTRACGARAGELQDGPGGQRPCERRAEPLQHPPAPALPSGVQGSPSWGLKGGWGARPLSPSSGQDTLRRDVGRHQLEDWLPGHDGGEVGARATWLPRTPSLGAQPCAVVGHGTRRGHPSCSPHGVPKLTKQCQATNWHVPTPCSVSRGACPAPGPSQPPARAAGAGQCRSRRDSGTQAGRE